MKSANAELEAERERGELGLRDIENVGEEGEEKAGYIEMNLGLGVLEEKTGEESESDSDDTSESNFGDSEMDGAKEEGKRRKSGDTKRKAEKDVLGKLMGQPRREKPAIEVIDKTE